MKTSKINKIAVIGLGYVGLANALLLDKKFQVTGYNPPSDKIKLLKKRISPLEDKEIKEYLKTSKAKWTSDYADIVGSDLYIIATPTDYNEEANYFDTSSIESTIENILKLDPAAKFLIKSTVPVGYTLSVRKQFKHNDIYFSPEFLREGRALYDNLYPSRIVIGDTSKFGKEVANVYLASVLNKPEVLFTNPSEAEAIKLFANTYLALRVAYFNEVDTYCALKGLSAEQIIRGVGLDPRIGTHYCNPSFGYGGYCLPKDTKQLRANFRGVPHNIVSAIVDANRTRKNFIAEQVLARNPRVVGVYRLTMKSGSDNFRQAAIFDIISILQGNGVDVIVHEPSIVEHEQLAIVNDLDDFISKSDIIIANRYNPILANYAEKLYSRDIFGGD